MRPIKNPTARAAIHVVLVLFALYCTLPFFWTTMQSFKTVRQASSRTPLFFFQPTGANYEELWIARSPVSYGLLGMVLLGLFATFVLLIVLRDRIPLSDGAIVLINVGIILFTLWVVPRIVDTAEFYDYFVNSMIVTIGVVTISMSIGGASGYALARYSGIEGVFILVAALGFRALPRMAFALPYYAIGQSTGLHDTYFMLIMVLVATNQPFTIWMMRAFFAEVPKAIEESARIDGLGPFQAFLRVIVPIAWPGIISTGLFSMLLAYHEFLLARVLTQSKWTLPVAIAQFTGGEDPGHVTLASAAAVSATIPIVIVIIFLQRNLVKGLASGSVKG